MCANYQPPTPSSIQHFGIGPPAFDYGETYPGSVAPFLTNQAPDEWLPGTFGLVPHWALETLARSTYNARSETAAEKPSFRSAWKKRQLCVIPVQAIYEPNYASGSAVRWRIERKDKQPYGLAGLWELRRREDGSPWYSFTMLTINADQHPFMRNYHKPDSEKRSVVVLADNAWEGWLNASGDAEMRSFLSDFEPDLMIGTPAPHRPKLSPQASLF